MSVGHCKDFFFQRMKFYYRYFSYSTQHLIDSRCIYLSLLCIHPSIHSLKIEAEKPHVSDTLLGTGDKAVSKADKSLALMELGF